MIGHDLNVGKGVKAGSRRQTRGIVKACNRRILVRERLFTPVRRRISSELSSPASAYKNAFFPLRTHSLPPYNRNSHLWFLLPTSICLCAFQPIDLTFNTRWFTFHQPPDPLGTELTSKR